jgi:hypothetical protein
MVAGTDHHIITNNNNNKDVLMSQVNCLDSYDDIVQPHINDHEFQAKTDDILDLSLANGDYDEDITNNVNESETIENGVYNASPVVLDNGLHDMENINTENGVYELDINIENGVHETNVNIENGVHETNVNIENGVHELDINVHNEGHENIEMDSREQPIPPVDIGVQPESSNSHDILGHKDHHIESSIIEGETTNIGLLNIENTAQDVETDTREDLPLNLCNTSQNVISQVNNDITRQDNSNTDNLCSIVEIAQKLNTMSEQTSRGTKRRKKYMSEPQQNKQQKIEIPLATLRQAAMSVDNCPSSSLKTTSETELSPPSNEVVHDDDELLLKLWYRSGYFSTGNDFIKVKDRLLDPTTIADHRSLLANMATLYDMISTRGLWLQTFGLDYYPNFLALCTFATFGNICHLFITIWLEHLDKCGLVFNESYELTTKAFCNIVQKLYPCNVRDNEEPSTMRWEISFKSQFSLATFSFPFDVYTGETHIYKYFATRSAIFHSNTKMQRIQTLMSIFNSVEPLLKRHQQEPQEEPQQKTTPGIGEVPSQPTAITHVCPIKLEMCQSYKLKRVDGDPLILQRFIHTCARYDVSWLCQQLLHIGSEILQKRYAEYCVNTQMKDALLPLIVTLFLGYLKIPLDSDDSSDDSSPEYAMMQQTKSHEIFRCDGFIFNKSGVTTTEVSPSFNLLDDSKFSSILAKIRNGVRSQTFSVLADGYRRQQVKVQSLKNTKYENIYPKYWFTLKGYLSTALILMGAYLANINSIGDSFSLT